MNDKSASPPPRDLNPPVHAAPPENPAAQRRAARTGPFVIWAVVIAACFALPLARLVRYSSNNEFFSYIPLVPFIAGYLIWDMRPRWPDFTARALVPALVCAGIAGALLGLYYGVFDGGLDLEKPEQLCFTTSAFLLLLLAGAFWFLGAPWMRALAFPAGFLVFMLPPPSLILDPVTAFMQITSAWAADMFMLLAGLPHGRVGTVITLSNISLFVAPECSGIHSTMALLLTALLAGHLFLRSRWNRAWLALAVLPLAIARNGFRVFVLGEFCVHLTDDIIRGWELKSGLLWRGLVAVFSPSVIRSPFHKQGGPLFFALSLIPFFLLLAWLRKRDVRSRAPAPAPAKS